MGQALYQESGHRDGWGSPWLGGFTEILHMPPNSSKEASTQCRQAQRKEGKGKEGFWRKSAIDVQTYFPSGSSVTAGRPSHPQEEHHAGGNDWCLGARTHTLERHRGPIRKAGALGDVSGGLRSSLV